MLGWQLVAVGTASLCAAGLVAATQAGHQRWTGDFEDGGVQTHHAGSPSRMGALPILFASVAPTSSAWCAAVLALYVLSYVLLFRHLVWFGRVFSPAPQLQGPKLGSSASAA